MRVDLFTMANEPERKFMFFKSLDLNFVPAKDSMYLDTENKVVYNVSSIIFKDNSVAIIVAPRNDEGELYNTFKSITEKD